MGKKIKSQKSGKKLNPHNKEVRILEVLKKGALKLNQNFGLTPGKLTQGKLPKTLPTWPKNLTFLEPKTSIFK